MYDNWYLLYIYMIVCYLTIVIGHLIVSGVGYCRLRTLDNDKYNGLLKNDKLQIVEKDGNEPYILRYGFTYYYCWPYLKKLIFLFLAFSPILLLGEYTVLSQLQSPWKRGLFTMLLFVLSIMLPMVIRKTFRGAPALIIVVSFLFGSLFWWIDTTHIRSGTFYDSLSAITATGDYTFEKINILLEIKKIMFLIVVGMFTFFSASICLVLSQIFIKYYKIRRICSLHISHLVVLIVLGSMGLFGGIAAEIGRQINEIIAVLTRI